MKRIQALAACLVSMLLAACLGDVGDGNSGPSVVGVAATGAAIASATVTLNDGNNASRHTTTGSDGSYSIDVSHLVAPFIIKVDVTGKGDYLFGFAQAAGTANINPITDLAVRAAAGTLSDPTAADIGKIEADLDASATQLDHILQPLLISFGVPADFDPLASAYTIGSNNPLDVLLDTIKVSVNAPQGTFSITNIQDSANPIPLLEAVGIAQIQDGTVQLWEQWDRLPIPPATAATTTEATPPTLLGFGSRSTSPSDILRGINKSDCLHGPSTPLLPRTYQKCGSSALIDFTLFTESCTLTNRGGLLTLTNGKDTISATLDKGPGDVVMYGQMQAVVVYASSVAVVDERSVTSTIHAEMRGWDWPNGRAFIGATIDSPSGKIDISCGNPYLK